jgi:hypothetical protein
MSGGATQNISTSSGTPALQPLRSPIASGTHRPVSNQTRPSRNSALNPATSNIQPNIRQMIIAAA